MERIHFIVEDIEAEVARLRAAGVRFRNDIISGPGGKQIVLDDPSGNSHRNVSSPPEDSGQRGALVDFRFFFSRR